jgi:transcriptional regulator with XRE-family HTH domain
MSDNELKAIFSNNLRKYVKKENTNFTELAKEIGVGKSAVSNWINGISLPRMDKIDLICNYLNISKSDLLETNPDTAETDFFSYLKTERKIKSRADFLEWIISIGITYVERRLPPDNELLGLVFNLKGHSYFFSNEAIEKLILATINSTEALISSFGEEVGW